MNIALLFNSDHESFAGYYGPSIREGILATGVLQRANREMRVLVGDVLTYAAAASSETPTRSYLLQLCQAVYTPIRFDYLIRSRLDATNGTATVYCWVFQNMTPHIGEELHERLHAEPGYLGAMDVEFDRPQHLYFFRNSLIELCRLSARHCSVFYTMGENEDLRLIRSRI